MSSANILGAGACVYIYIICIQRGVSQFCWRGGPEIYPVVCAYM